MKPILLPLLLLFLSSCYKEVDIDLPKRKPKLVIGSYITANEPIGAVITQSVPANDTVFTLKTKAQVSVAVNGEEYPLTHIKDSLYRSTIKVRHGRTYTIRASAPGYETVHASDSIPRPVGFGIKKYVATANVDNEGENISSITIDIKNIPDVPTFFELRMLSTVIYNWDEKDWTSVYYEGLHSQDITIRNEGLVNLSANKVGLLFTNELMQGSSHSLSFDFYNLIGDEHNSIDKVEIQLRTVSAAYYKFKKRLYPNLDNQVGDLWDGTGNPIDAYTNVVNGYGIFAGYSQVSHSKNL
ncbi:protein of unknown function [Saccharicrinis carchari]|uniref:DUF4249 domain-containing protein n=1 Tax=Saccharicrinis carchari TaxID=1168039 RepID=A0A521AD91_SACCC|nr:DUF4249 domain-containing protein [Saccharicrinis carchari]SMO32751.1 protein of unknown function [Saccharicrinis carchari]